LHHCQWLRARREKTYAYDFTVSHLGYSTAKGAYYYYMREHDPETEENLSYEDTLLEVTASLRGSPCFTRCVLGA
jgi:hypothetical protein